MVTTVKGRTAHLAQTLPKNLMGNPKSRFIILDYGGQDAELTRMLRPYAHFAQVSVYQYRTDGPFRMAHAKNMAHRLGILEGADVLVNVDADNYLHNGFEDFVASVFKGGDANAERSGLHNARPFLWAGVVRGKGRKLRGVSGRIAVTPAAFLKAGGYDEKFVHWGHDDTDFNQRLQFLGYEPVEIPLSFLECIPHGDGLRFRDYPEAQPDDQTADQPPPPPRSGIANYGNVGGGTVYRRDGSKIELAPIPTRIFGIGMHKTATTSLHAALQMLGFESSHWPSGGWARKVYDEMCGTGLSPTLEGSYAASDLPISILYEELDRAYPGSKFILTLRDEVDWLRSVRDHFTDKNPHRWEWNVYPFSNRMHKAVYGRKDFEAVTFLQRYRRHNAEVIEYFRNRPKDLLVMQEPHDWPALCRFLGRPVPSVEYPRKFVTRRWAPPVELTREMEVNEYGPYSIGHIIGAPNAHFISGSDTDTAAQAGGRNAASNSREHAAQQTL